MVRREHGRLESPALERFLDSHGLGGGPVRVRQIGDGTSNLTYLLERDGTRLVLRRPPPPPLPPSAHDVVREARVQLGLAQARIRVPRVLAVCEDNSILGSPFYIMEELRGVVVGEHLPPSLDTSAQRRHLGEEVLDNLVDLHAVNWDRPELRFGPPTGYLQRQLRRWTELWNVNATRDLPLCTRLGERLTAACPVSPPATVVHGDFRMGNLMVAPEPPARVTGILDWEMATIGDPLADLGYLTATWSERGAAEHPLLLTPVTGRFGFPTRAELAARYAQRTGREVSRLPWYQAFALWKAAIFCEATYARFLRGERTDAWSASLGDGVPRLLELADAMRDRSGPE